MAEKHGVGKACVRSHTGVSARGDVRPYLTDASCGGSIPSNIAEGYGRIYDKERINFLSIALGSASELETQLMISEDLGFTANGDNAELSSLNNEVIRMLTSLIKGIRGDKSPC